MLLRKALVHIIVGLNSANSIRCSSSTLMKQRPLLFVLGPTGAGKSKLALDLALKLNGEIVSADSMQVYQGLDIVTNKVTPEEQAVCPHHLIGFLPPLQEYTIVDFKKHALELIEEIHARRRLPVVCGGTNYYIESVIWEYLVPTNDGRGELRNDESLEREENASLQLRNELEKKDSIKLHKLLQEIDPERASVLHPNDRRKIIRSIEVYEQSGQKHSDLIKEQKGDHRYGGSLLFSNVCLLYVKCDEKVLEDRINRRVDKMIDSGLVEELKNFHEEYNKDRLAKGLEVDYEHGIFQSIGFKEFHQYLTFRIHDDEHRKKLFDEAVERMKLSTWQYAKYQNKWIRKRIINRKGALPVYAVDSTNPGMWDELVLNPALNLLSHVIDWDNFVEGVDANSVVFNTAKLAECAELQPVEACVANSDDSERVMKSCDVCGGKIFLTEDQWQVHIQSKRHKRIAAGRLKQLHETTCILNAHKNNLEGDVAGGSCQISREKSDWTEERIEIHSLYDEPS